MLSTEKRSFSWTFQPVGVVSQQQQQLLLLPRELQQRSTRTFLWYNTRVKLRSQKRKASIKMSSEQEFVFQTDGYDPEHHVLLRKSSTGNNIAANRAFYAPLVEDQPTAFAGLRKRGDRRQFLVDIIDQAHGSSGLQFVRPAGKREQFEVVQIQRTGYIETCKMQKRV